MNIEDPIFTIRQAADSADLSVNTVRTWFQRGHFKLGLTDKANEGDGLARFVSARTAIALGITNSLANGVFGVHPKDAARAAAVFAHVGADGRRMGLPFNRSEAGETILCVYADGTTTVLFREPEKDLIELVAEMRTWRDGFILLPCDKIVTRVLGALGYVARDVIDEAYGIK